MATETATKQNDTKPAASAKAATPKRKPAAKSRTRARSARKPAASRAGTRSAAPRTEAKALNGGQQFVAGVIDAQEKTVTAIVDYQVRAAELSRVPGATAIADAQAQVLRSVTDVYVSAARTFLK